MGPTAKTLAFRVIIARKKPTFVFVIALPC